MVRIINVDSPHVNNWLDQTVRRAIAMSEDEAPVEGTWALIKIYGAEPFETFEFEGELTLK
jgi:hypothetical protein